MKSQPDGNFPNFASGVTAVTFGYTASCCDPEVIIIVTDIDANVGTCYVNNGEMDNSQGEQLCYCCKNTTIVFPVGSKR